MSKIAHELAKLTNPEKPWQVVQRHYQLSPPHEGCEFVVVSCAYLTTIGMFDETYIFPADEEGHITDFGELEGSFQGVCSFEMAFQNIGYTIVPMDDQF